MHWAGSVGLDKVHDAIVRYGQTLESGHWKPSALLARLAKEGKTFEDFDKEQQDQ